MRISTSVRKISQISDKQRFWQESITGNWFTPTPPIICVMTVRTGLSQSSLLSALARIFLTVSLTKQKMQLLKQSRLLKRQESTKKPYLPEVRHLQKPLTRKVRMLTSNTAMRYHIRLSL